MFGARVGSAFERIGAAEEELARACPKRKLEPKGLFLALRETDVLDARAPIAIWRVHFREVIARALRGDDLRPATNGEILYVYSEASLRAPLRADAAAIADHLFEATFPEAHAKLPGVAPREQWAGQVADDVAYLRRTLSTTNRRLDLFS